jgi:uncharacterized protein YggE
VAERDIQTSGPRPQPQYTYPNRTAGTSGPPRITAYQVSNQVTVLVRDLTKLGPAVDAVVGSGANQINGISFGLANADARADEARRQAVANVARKAELYAQAAGLRLVRLVTLSESGGYTPRPPVVMMRQAMARRRTPPPPSSRARWASAWTSRPSMSWPGDGRLRDPAPRRARAAMGGLAALLTAAAPVAAQTPAIRFDPAPWWMAQPVISSIGYVSFELRANRASFSANFQAVERTAEAAQRRAAEQVRGLSTALRAYGPERVSITTINLQPLYEQYRDRQGTVQENQRADQVERYSGTAFVSVEVRDVSVLERVYATVLAARPTSVGGVGFSLEPGDAVRTALHVEAVRDAQSRARQSAEAAGARLGPAKVIDPSGRACETDVLTGYSNFQSADVQPREVESITVTGSRVRRGAPPPPPPVVEAPPPSASPAPDGASLPPELQGLALQPPLQKLTSRACVVYGLAG